MAKKNDELRVGKLTDLPKEEFVSTGISEVDTLLGGGFPKGRITQIWGNPGVGKSYLLAKTMAELAGRTLYIDAEFALNSARLQNLGVDFDKVDHIASSELEKIAEYTVENAHRYELIIIDTLAKLTPMTVMTNEVGTSAIGLAARQIAHFEAKLRPKLYEHRVVLVGINQVRANFGFGPVTTQPFGGWSWGHTVDLSLKLSKGAQNKIVKQEKGVKREIGHWVTVKVEKSRLTAPHQETKFPLMY